MSKPRRCECSLFVISNRAQSLCLTLTFILPLVAAYGLFIVMSFFLFAISFSILVVAVIDFCCFFILPFFFHNGMETVNLMLNHSAYLGCCDGKLTNNVDKNESNRKETKVKSRI